LLARLLLGGLAALAALGVLLDRGVDGAAGVDHGNGGLVERHRGAAEGVGHARRGHVDGGGLLAADHDSGAHGLDHGARGRGRDGGSDAGGGGASGEGGKVGRGDERGGLELGLDLRAGAMGELDRRHARGGGEQRAGRRHGSDAGGGPAEHRGTECCGRCGKARRSEE